MRPLIICEWRDMPESPRVAAVIMANDLEAIARAVRIGEGGHRTQCVLGHPYRCHH